VSRSIKEKIEKRIKKKKEKKELYNVLVFQ
jgi:hypothetical protein